MLFLKGLRILALSALLVMLGAVLYGFVRGGFVEEGRVIGSLAWGKVTLVDLYVGLAFFAAWVIHRERSVGRAAPWLALLVVLRNLAAALYLILALRRCQGDRYLFWHGKTLSSGVAHTLKSPFRGPRNPSAVLSRAADHPSGIPPRSGHGAF
ncbi:MAG: DUF1475 family protein [Thermovirgaceae bacterium]